MIVLFAPLELVESPLPSSLDSSFALVSTISASQFRALSLRLFEAGYLQQVRLE
jgi:hypothetical protein